MWAFAPHLDRPLFDSGGSCDEGIAFGSDNHRENRRLDVHFAVDEMFAQRELRAVGFDQEAKRYLFPQRGHGQSKTLAMYHCALAYEEVPHGTVTHLGIEVKAATTVRSSDLSGLRDLAGATGDRFVRGIVLYLGNAVVPFGPRLHAVPLPALWEW